MNGPSYDIWADEIPQERTKLLQLCQESLNVGHTLKIVFITGNKYLTEFMAKKTPSGQKYGPEQVFTELLTPLSGLVNGTLETSNSNRLHVTNNIFISSRYIIG